MSLADARVREHGYVSRLVGTINIAIEIDHTRAFYHHAVGWDSTPYRILYIFMPYSKRNMADAVVSTLG